ncbi:dimethylmenaquinone methyltransferase [Niastella vici]|uniref:Dimethylmenaquinone methyltransferase n=1 Tax=Niastella vici TaxID=1703345 RepID=A0A1V9FSH1_9BACT|nr:dimethylmenaquinone methyltransferase [Niastella vici]OQP61293.1 dimethylmenaquinone methyltransferase [Niastella vici]
MKRIIIILVAFLYTITGALQAQTIARDELVFLTSEWKGERFPDGRPKIPDELIRRARNIAMEDAWTILSNEGYTCQYEGNWKTVNNDTPVVGRALTACFMPSRPDVEKNIKERGKKEGRVGNTNAWPIDMLTKGDVYVADGFGKISGGTLIGSNLGNAIFSKTGTGVVFDAAARDLEGLAEIKGFNAYVRDWHPSYLKEEVLMGLNAPIRIGHAMVMPGDLVIAKKGGVLFIPAHMAENVIVTAEFIILKDKFGISMLKAGRYTPGQIDNQWTDKIKQDFLDWLQKNPNEIPMTRAQLDEYMKKRTW